MPTNFTFPELNGEVEPQAFPEPEDPYWSTQEEEKETARQELDVLFKESIQILFGGEIVKAEALDIVSQWRASMVRGPVTEMKY